jgi:hypothetical protein
MMALADMSGSLLDGFATTQRDWAEFVHPGHDGPGTVWGAQGAPGPTCIGLRASRVTVPTAAGTRLVHSLRVGGAGGELVGDCEAVKDGRQSATTAGLALMAPSTMADLPWSG